MIGAISSPASHTLFSTYLYSQSFIPPLDLHLHLPRSSNGGLATKLLCKSVNAQVTQLETETKKRTRGGAIDIENLTTWLLKQEQAGAIDAELTIELSSIALACKKIASLLQRSSIINLTGGHGTTDVQGEDQKKLDVVSNEVFCSCLRSSGRTGIIASEEEDVPVAVEETYSGNYVVVFDPIDGSSNIDTALTTGSIFGIFGPDRQCLVDLGSDSMLDQERQKCFINVCQLGSNLLAAGYCLYASSVVFALSIGHGVIAFTLDPKYGEFVLTHRNIKIPKTGTIYSFNEGCLVGEIHRMLLCGGIYGNPANEKSKNGNLRLLYECAPMSYLIEQAGGKATDGHQRILNIQPAEIHQRTPIFHWKCRGDREVRKVYGLNSRNLLYNLQTQITEFGYSYLQYKKVYKLEQCLNLLHLHFLIARMAELSINHETICIVVVTF